MNHCFYCGRHCWNPWLTQNLMTQRTSWKRMSQCWTLSSENEARCSSPASRSPSLCAGGPWVWLWPLPHPSQFLWQPQASRRWCLWWPLLICHPGEESTRWTPTNTSTGSPPYGLNPRWDHVQYIFLSAVCFLSLFISCNVCTGICEAALSAIPTSVCWHAAWPEEWCDRVQCDPAGENSNLKETVIIWHRGTLQ